jgi:hypothetical protein
MVVDRSLMAEADAMAVIRIIHLITEQSSVFCWL